MRENSTSHQALQSFLLKQLIWLCNGQHCCYSDEEGGGTRRRPRLCTITVDSCCRNSFRDVGVANTNDSSLVVHRDEDWTTGSVPALIVKKRKGRNWEVWNREDPLFGSSKFAQCDWVKFKPHFADTKLAKSINATTSSEHFMCVHNERDYVADSIRAQGHWSDCNQLSVMWDEYLATNKHPTGRHQQQPKKTREYQYHFEIGANIGACVMQVLLTTPDYVHVVAFEPNPKNLFCLTSTLNRLPLGLQRRVTLFPVALGATMQNSTINMAVGNYGNSVVSKVIGNGPDQRFLDPVPI